MRTLTIESNGTVPAITKHSCILLETFVAKDHWRIAVDVAAWISASIAHNDGIWLIYLYDKYYEKKETGCAYHFPMVSESELASTTINAFSLCVVGDLGDRRYRLFGATEREDCLLKARGSRIRDRLDRISLFSREDEEIRTMSS